MSHPPILSLHHVWFSYNGAHDVLQDVSLEVYPGTINAILGPNGAGKSTLLHLILGLYRPRQGEIRVGGQPLTAYSRRSRSRQMAWVPQREHFPFEFRVLEYVLLGRTPHLDFLQMPGPGDVQAARQALERLGIADLADRRVSALSGGEHQMVLIARAVAQETPILLLDEPTAHLDLANQRRILTLLEDLAAQGTTVLFTTHDPEAALAVADTCTLMRSGRILDQGPAAEVITTETLTRTYETPLRVLSVDGARVVRLDLPPRPLRACLKNKVA
ncbi:MAG: ABC transporter ATP-binding protein [Anaerolineae bacterium]|nr:ABC transporter ATP-binding protein [Anaerolineae bacterium]MDW8067352.1 ABC transporter ATP-binding protein [Anaerolineae bacterium]